MCGHYRPRNRHVRVRADGVSDPPGRPRGDQGRGRSRPRSTRRAEVSPAQSAVHVVRGSGRTASKMLGNLRLFKPLLYGVGQSRPPSRRQSFGSGRPKPGEGDERYPGVSRQLTEITRSAVCLTREVQLAFQGLDSRVIKQRFQAHFQQRPEDLRLEFALGAFKSVQRAVRLSNRVARQRFSVA